MEPVDWKDRLAALEPEPSQRDEDIHYNTNYSVHTALHMCVHMQALATTVSGDAFRRPTLDYGNLWSQNEPVQGHTRVFSAST